MTSENLRLFFAVNIPKEVKEEIAEKLLPLIPKEKWRKVLPENLHVTIEFLGHLPREAVNGLEGKVQELESFEGFEAEMNCIGQFKGRVLWIGFGKGTEDFNLLGRKLQEALELRNGRFHAHITLARNKGMGKKETDALVERLRAAGFKKTIEVKSLELMQSELHKAGPEYSVVFSREFRAREQAASKKGIQAGQ
ncbi:MAG: RNA 2',3'-cyclic phosphodiesterase [Candidatus Diapherotrites archaeon]|uniref:RNA 2',3'-cyclic phosphodiesterase n=1 Tax=Candidatus Iainarchaeum sp. TaxID=3101447 RepID=A0A939C8S9_9ARCH|nr:RNA 2',3'-cyclic phosphodiesterase [Candidatus Diapherotrites archaeon]